MVSKYIVGASFVSYFKESSYEGPEELQSVDVGCLLTLPEMKFEMSGNLADDFWWIKGN